MAKLGRDSQKCRKNSVKIRDFGNGPKFAPPIVSNSEIKLGFS